MKIFAVYTRLTFTRKPSGLDDFRKKYDKLFEYHITLKQPCFVDENEVEQLKIDTATIFSSLGIPKHKIEVVFDNLEFHHDQNDQTLIMLNARHNDELSMLQNNVREGLGKYDKYVEFKTKEYEDNFRPHITIARNLDGKKLKSALIDLGDDYICEAIINEVVLSIVKEDTPEEAKNSLNMTFYRL